MEVDKYEALEVIGRGSFGIIRKVRRKADGHILCRKEIAYGKMNSREREQLRTELEILKGLRHPNVVQYYDREHLQATSDLHIYMEYCEEGDLGQKIKELKEKNCDPPEDFLWSVLAQVVSGLYRCHYGVDAPEVGANSVGLYENTQPLRTKAAHNTILHRDLKPDNIFLGADSTVKLGDFGLSKSIASNDFAQTYVGTPFYMSPEICRSEPYGAHSDIWALGCIMYELCMKIPPFNARNAIELSSKIQMGKVTKPINAIYSRELRDVIHKCLSTNPMSRPLTAELINVPTIKLKRKELQLLQAKRQAESNEQKALQRLKTVERRFASQIESEKQKLREELDDSLRRGWEVKARLEIDRQVAEGLDKMRVEMAREVNHRVEAGMDAAWKTFEQKVAAEVEMRLAGQQSHGHVRSLTPDAADLPAGGPSIGYHQSQSTSGETDDFPSTTDLTESLDSSLHLQESPTLDRFANKALRRSGRTPFGRAQTMFDQYTASPMDVPMADPSPAPIGPLGLSPRRNATKARTSLLARNIFAAAAGSDHGNPTGAYEHDQHLAEMFDDSDDDDDGVPNLPSPTRAPSGGDPFKAPAQRNRPGMTRAKTVSQPKASQSQPPIFSNHPLPRPPSSSNLKENRPPSSSTKPTSPRRMSKVNSTTATDAPTSPQRRDISSPPKNTGFGALPRLTSKKQDDNIRQTAMFNSQAAHSSGGQMQGRTLVELAQARSAAPSGGIEWHDFALDAAGREGSVKGMRAASETAATWDPERDEMPSPFLVRGRNILLEGARGGPGMRHLR